MGFERLTERKNMAEKKVANYLFDHKDQLVKAQASVLMLQMVMKNAFAASTNNNNTGTDIFTRASNMMGTIYSSIAGISSVTAGCVAAVCLYLMFFSKNQSAVDSSIQWLKRIFICWISIMLMSTIIYFVVKNLNIGNSQKLSGW